MKYQVMIKLVFVTNSVGEAEQSCREMKENARRYCDTESGCIFDTQIKEIK